MTHIIDISFVIVYNNTSRQYKMNRKIKLKANTSANLCLTSN